MEDIAQPAGRSKGRLYTHFPRQQALLHTLEQREDAFVGRTLQRLADPAIQPVPRPQHQALLLRLLRP